MKWITFGSWETTYGKKHYIEEINEDVNKNEIEIRKLEELNCCFTKKMKVAK